VGLDSRRSSGDSTGGSKNLLDHLVCTDEQGNQNRIVGNKFSGGPNLSRNILNLRRLPQDERE